MDFRSLSCLILDLDGVVYQGDEVIAGAPEAIAHFRNAGKKIAFLTNNSGSSASKVIEKLCRLGIPCNENDLMTAGQAAAIFIREHCLDSGKGVFVVGTDALRQELLARDLMCSQPDTCGALLVGLDPNFHYAVVAQALSALNRSISFIICNRDASYPGRNGVPMPGCGAMVGAIEASSERTADFEVGKPNTLMLELIAQRLQVKPEDCLVVGDSLSSDILMANRAGVASVWISDATPSSIAAVATPDLCLPSLKALEPFFL